MKTPILGSSYVARSVNAGDNRMVNLFPEMLAEGGKEAAFLNRAPGLRLLATIGTGPIRGMWSYGGLCYVVSGNSLYSLNSAYTSTLLGTVAGSGQVSMADNGVQLFIAANGPSYIYDNVALTFVQITDPDFPGAVQVGYLDELFVFTEPVSQKVWVTAILDGTDINGLDYSVVNGAPDSIVSMIIDHREVWLLGDTSGEVWYNTGSVNAPLDRIQGAFNEIGCAATFSVAKMDNSIFWLGADARGKGIVYRANGYTGTRISTHAVEWQIQQYPTISDAVAYTYQQDGHAFYVLTFPAANTTWVYDASTQLWHERAGFSAGAFTRHRGDCQVAFNGETIIGDFENGNLYAFDLNVFADNGSTQRWMRSWRALPTGANTLKRTSHHALQLDCESGVGLNSGQGSDPQVMLRWSDDGGHTWSNEHWKSMGALGNYGTRVIWRRLGMTTKLRDRIYEISGTDPVKISINGAELLMSNTSG